GIAQTRQYFALRILDTTQVSRLVAFFFRRRCNDLTFHLSRRSRARRRNESRQQARVSQVRTDPILHFSRRNASTARARPRPERSRPVHSSSTIPRTA